MDVLSLLRTMGALGVVLGLLAGALWLVRRYNIKLPGGVVGDGAGRRVALVERVGIDSRRSIALVRRDGREHLILIAPEGHLVVETAIVRDKIDASAAEARALEARASAAAAEAAAVQTRENFRELVADLGERSSRAVQKLGNGVARLRSASAALKPAGVSFRALVASAERSIDTLGKTRARPAPPTPPAPKRARAKAAPGATGARKRTVARPRTTAVKEKVDG